MNTAVEFYRMRDKGRIFVCLEHGMADVGPNGNALLVVFAPPNTDEMGFYRETLGKAVIA